MNSGLVAFAFLCVSMSLVVSEEAQRVCARGNLRWSSEPGIGSGRTSGVDHAVKLVAKGQVGPRVTWSRTLGIVSTTENGSFEVCGEVRAPFPDPRIEPFLQILTAIQRVDKQFPLLGPSQCFLQDELPMGPKYMDSKSVFELNADLSQPPNRSLTSGFSKCIPAYTIDYQLRTVFNTTLKEFTRRNVAAGGSERKALKQAACAAWNYHADIFDTLCDMGTFRHGVFPTFQGRKMFLESPSKKS